jgi:predicted dehydrogenase
VGAIGCGSHATTPIWPELPNAGFVLEAVCSRSIDRATAAARRCGVAHAFDDAEKMLDEVDLDALVIVVPPEAFAQYIRLAIERELAAFVEKPGASAAAEAEELAQLASEANANVVVGYQKRFASAYRKAREVMSAEMFGEPTLATFMWVMGPFRQRVTLREWLFCDSSTGIQAEGEGSGRAAVVGVPLPARGARVGEASGRRVRDSRRTPLDWRCAFQLCFHMKEKPDI